MAKYLREELSMLMAQVAAYSAELLTAKSKRQRKLIESDISVTIAEIEDCYKDYICETRTVAI